MATDYLQSELLYRKCYKAVIEAESDVQFLFESESGIVQIPANKAVLSASSPVFDAMFNGDLKEKGDVNIIDATPEAFQVFLQLFYGYQGKLTMANIAEVLMLADKYDVADCIPVCIDFLKRNVQIGDILWVLSMAIQFNLDELRLFCEQKIQQNYRTVFDTIGMKNGQLWVASDNRLTEIDLEIIFPYLFSISRNIFSNMAVKLDSSFLPINLTTKGYSHVTVKNTEALQFSLNESMLLARIICSDIFICDDAGFHVYTSHPFQITIDERSNLTGRLTKTLFTQNVMIKSVEKQKNYIELQPPIWIEPNHTYTIAFKTNSIPKGLCTQRANIPDTPTELAPDVRITFGPTCQKHFHSLISQLYFKYAHE